MATVLQLPPHLQHPIDTIEQLGGGGGEEVVVEGEEEECEGEEEECEERGCDICASYGIPLRLGEAPLPPPGIVSFRGMRLCSVHLDCILPVFSPTSETPQVWVCFRPYRVIHYPPEGSAAKRRN